MRRALRSSVVDGPHRMNDFLEEIFSMSPTFLELEFVVPAHVRKVRMTLMNGQAWLCARDLASCLDIPHTGDFYRVCYPSPLQMRKAPMPSGGTILVWLTPCAVMQGLKSRKLRNKKLAQALRTWLEKEVLSKLDLDPERQLSQLRTLEFRDDPPRIEPEHRNAGVRFSVPGDLAEYWLRQAPQPERQRVQAALVDAIARVQAESQARRHAAGLH